MGIVFSDDQRYESQPLTETQGHLLLKLTQGGELSLRFNNREVLSAQLEQDYTKMQPGYISCGLIRDRRLPEGEPNIFGGKIHNLRVNMNTLSRSPAPNR